MGTEATTVATMEERVEKEERVDTDVIPALTAMVLPVATHQSQYTLPHFPHRLLERVEKVVKEVTTMATVDTEATTVVMVDTTEVTTVAREERVVREDTTIRPLSVIPAPTAMV